MDMKIAVIRSWAWCAGLLVIAGLCLTRDARAQGNVESDRAALLALSNATGGPSWTDNTNWLTDAPLGDWYGVEMDGDGRVTLLQLVGNGLTGPIPPQLGNLDQLRWLIIEANPLTGSIPSELGNLTNLRELALNENRLSGRIPPKLGDLVNLEYLQLRRNQLSGPIPSSLGNLTNLRELALNDQNFAEHNEGLSGSIPVELARLSSRRRLPDVGNAAPAPRHPRRNTTGVATS